MKKGLLKSVLALSMALGLSACSSEDDKYHIGVIEIMEHEALDLATKGFKDAVIEGLGEENVAFDVQNAGGDSDRVSTIANGFVSSNVDLILANATPSLMAAKTATADIPILGTAVTEYGATLGIDGYDGVCGGNISGTSDLAPLDQQAQMVKELFPEAKTVALLYCTAEPNSKYQVDTIKPLLENLGYTVEFYGFADTTQLQGIVEKAATCDVIYVPTDNTCAASTDTIDAARGTTPVIAGEKGICKGCGVATLSIDYYELGYITGEMAVKILKDGADISTMPIEYVSNLSKQYVASRAEEAGCTIPSDYEEIVMTEE